MYRENLTCFKAYDIRGKLGNELNEDIAYRIGRATAQSIQAKNIVVGFDARQTSPLLSNALSKGICDAGADVLKIGLAGTEEMYSAVSEFNADAGVEVTASHNPINYNGMKIVKYGSEPLLSEEFFAIKKIAETNNFFAIENLGSEINKENDARRTYLSKLLSFIDVNYLKPLKIVINSGNGVAGPVIDDLQLALTQKGIKTEFIPIHHSPNSTFPNGIPNPLLENNRFFTSKIIKEEKADFGVAFDGDFDRCFLFDHLGHFVPSEYIVGLLAEFFLLKEQGATIIHDTRVISNTMDVIANFGGRAVASKTGHAFIKKMMRQEHAIYGGEMSAHHYFRDFSYCDSGMIPWMLIWERLSKEDVLLSDLVRERRRLFPSSGEINFTVSDASQCLEMIKGLFVRSAKKIDELDGLSISFDAWRFNLRKSNTEPLVRLNVETNGDELLLKTKTKELSKLIDEISP